MFKIKKYVAVNDLEEAYTLNQKRINVILGGNLWLRMGNRRIQTAIDLTNLELNKIEENDHAFEIGCMTTLREIEKNKSLNTYFSGAVAQSIKNIVGVQFRNLATIGGSIFARFGFSDILTCLLALDTYVELYKGGIIPLSKFVQMPKDNDILVKVIINKDSREVSYLTHRRSKSDLPVLTCAVTRVEEQWQVVVGARPKRAQLVVDKENFLSLEPTEDEMNRFLNCLYEEVAFDSNMRGSAEYRKHLAGVLVKRGIKEIMKRKVGA